MATGSPMRPMASPIVTGNPGVRRVHTVPARFIGSSPSPLMPAPDAVETLFIHTNVKIVQFTVTSRPGSSGGRRGSEPGSPGPASIPWQSASERTLANGPFQIYRVPSSGVAFINSGNFLRHILPKTQCWCVDDVSKFVLRVNRHGSFYRIELPSETENDKIRVEEFRKVLSEILLFEKSPSPFLTGNVMAEEEPPATPIRKSVIRQPSQAKKWVLNKVWEPEDEDYRAHLRRVSTDSGTSRVRQAVRLHEAQSPRSYGSPISSRSTSATPSEDRFERPIEEEHLVEKLNVDDIPAQDHDVVDHLVPPSRPGISLGDRTVTAPAQLQYRPLTPPELTKPDERFDSPLRDQEEEDDGVSSSQNSFYSVEDAMGQEQSTAEPTEAEFATNLIDTSARSNAASRHRRDASDVTVRADPALSMTELDVFTTAASTNSRAPTPSILLDTVSDDDEDELTQPEPIITDPPTPTNTLRLRKLAKRLSESSYSQAQNVSSDRLSGESQVTTTTTTTYYTPPVSPRTEALLSTMMQKAYALFIGPPAHLIATMLRIASRVCLGLPIFYDSEDVGPSHTGRRRRSDLNDSGASSDPGRVPGYWEETSNSSVASSQATAEDDEEVRGRGGKEHSEEEVALQEWEKDDYGNPLHFVPRSSSSRASSLASSHRDSLLGVPAGVGSGGRIRRRRLSSSASDRGSGGARSLSRSVSNSSRASLAHEKLDEEDIGDMGVD